MGSVFRDNVTQLRVALKQHPTVIIGAGRKGRSIAADLLERHDEKAVIVEQQAGHKSSAELRRAGHLVIKGDAAFKETLKSAGALKARQLICFARDQTVGVQVAGQLRELWRKKAGDGGEHCDCHVHLDNPRLVDLFRSHGNARDEAVRVHFFNLHKMMARSLFQRLPQELAPALQRGEVRKLRVDLIGFTNPGQAILLQGLRVLHLGLAQGVAWHVWVDASQGTPGSARQALLARHPLADEVADIRFHSVDAQYRALLDAQAGEAEGTLSLVICALPSDEASLTAAAEILHATPSGDFRVFALCEDASGLAALLTGPGQANQASQRLKLFGNLEEFCTVEMICGAQQDRLAQAIHADYLQLTQGTAGESDAYKTAWEALDEDARDANRAQADHLPYKLMLVGGSVANIDEQALEFLAAIEHQRWAAHRYLNGWRYGPERDDERRLHPSLVPWAELSEGEREKDRDAVRRMAQLQSLGKGVL
ncbi:hypothetical protein SDC9_86854 [bioreactor metagenome]|uniref:RCK N-terminal domain-containing protein n=1 Tax=bioreactor metagenome TaxID=1076179 RepID=A0A644ZRI1_9ZZZZ